MSNAFAAALISNRARFNAKFAEARHSKPKLDSEAFADLLRTTVAPIVEAVHQIQPDSTYPVTESLYDISLDLLVQDLLGPHARHPILAAGWSQLLPKLARHIASDPRAVVGGITNALYNLAVTPSARPGEWLKDVLALADHAPDVETLLKAGQICSWRAGLAHYRAAALDLCEALPPGLARLTLGLPLDDPRPIDSIIARLRADPWQSPVSGPGAQSPKSQLRIAKRVGAFRGFGGLFLVPPLVFASADHFIVTDGEDTWLLTADHFGATFHRVPQPPPETSADSPFKLSRSGEVTASKLKGHFSELAQSTSQAANAATLAVTVPSSHAIYLVALVETGE